VLVLGGWVRVSSAVPYVNSHKYRYDWTNTAMTGLETDLAVS
jgi:hypothetical protein